MATATTTTAAVKVRKARKPSDFTTATRVNIMVHKGLDADSGGPTDIASALRDWYGPDDALSLRFVQRTRKTAKGTGTGPRSLSLYIAPKDYAFPKAGGSRGMRVEADIAAIIRAKATEMGLDATDANVANEVLRALLSKVSAQ